ncbi:MAG: class I mannose-6-phosphate isomerase [Chloroflexota bacterium]
MVWEGDGMNPYPLKLTFHVRSYAFGERLIPERLGKAIAGEGRVAETWEISDYRDTTGTVTNGELRGTTLHELVESYPDEIVARGWSGPHFPLLEKFLDASHMLPVHLHADDETARRVYNEPNGKTEAWHILWAAPGATILAGVKPGAGRDDLFRAYRAERYDEVMPRFPIHAGDTVYVPGGVIHSFGPDTLIFEVQQTSDLGQSVMPTDLFGNRLSEEEWSKNIDAALDELRTDFQPRPNSGLAIHDGANQRVVGCAGPFFALERWTIREPFAGLTDRDRFLTLSSVGGAVDIEYAAGTWEGAERLQRGESCILPAALEEWRIVPLGEASLIACYVPDLPHDIVEPLTAAGFSQEQIESLGQI